MILTKKVRKALNTCSARQRQLKERSDYVAEMPEKAKTVGLYEGPTYARAPERPPGGGSLRQGGWIFELKIREISQG